MLSTKGLDIKIPAHIRERAERALAEAWEDYDVQLFLKKHADVIDDNVKQSANTTILNFVQGKNDPLYHKELVIYAGHIYLHEKPKETIGKKLRDDNVNRVVTFDAITKSVSNVEVYDEGKLGALKAERFLANFLENYQYGAKQKGMWLHGDRGVGKTYLMGYFAKKLREQNIGFTFLNAAQLYKDMLDVQRNFSKYINKNVWKVKTAQVLIIDDMGAEKASDFMINDIMFEIMDYRMTRNLPTFCTSNYNKSDYENYILNKGLVQKMEAGRYRERLDTLMTEIQMNGVNRRDKA